MERWLAGVMTLSRSDGRTFSAKCRTQKDEDILSSITTTPPKGPPSSAVRLPKHQEDTATACPVEAIGVKSAFLLFLVSNL